MTQVLRIHEQNPEKRVLKKAIETLEAGGVILTPGETGYCYVGKASQEKTRDLFLQLRPGHPTTKPFTLLCQDIRHAGEFAHLSTVIYRLAAKVWPGPYTLIFEATKTTPHVNVGRKRKTVGIQVSAHPILSELIKGCNFPLLHTSVTDEDELINQNYFNSDSTQLQDFWWTQAESISQHVSRGLIALALENDQPVPMHVSTVIDFTGETPILVRDGGWDPEFTKIFEVSK